MEQGEKRIVKEEDMKLVPGTLHHNTDGVGKTLDVKVLQVREVLFEEVV